MRLQKFSTTKISQFTVPFIIARHYPTQNQADDFYMDYCLTWFYSLYQQTPIHAAAKNHHDYTVQLLIEKEADVNIKDNNGVSMWSTLILWFANLSSQALLIPTKSLKQYCSLLSHLKLFHQELVYWDYSINAQLKWTCTLACLEVISLYHIFFFVTRLLYYMLQLQKAVSTS